MHSLHSNHIGLNDQRLYTNFRDREVHFHSLTQNHNIALMKVVMLSLFLPYQSFRTIIITPPAALSYVTYVGCGLSIATLLIAIFTVLLIR